MDSQSNYHLLMRVLPKVPMQLILLIYSHFHNLGKLQQHLNLIQTYSLSSTWLLLLVKPGFNRSWAIDSEQLITIKNVFTVLGKQNWKISECLLNDDVFDYNCDCGKRIKALLIDLKVEITQPT